VLEALGLAAALLGCGVGLAWVALSMEVHWHQVHGGRRLTTGTVRALRALGACALAGALMVCFAVDHPTMAVLVWFMALAAGSVGVAFTLAWRPRLLRPLVLWAR
jgi:hypothetical protein